MIYHNHGIINGHDNDGVWEAIMGYRPPPVPTGRGPLPHLIWRPGLYQVLQQR